MTNRSRSKSIDEAKMGGGSRDEKEGIELRLRINEHATKVVAERFQNGTLPDHSSRFPKFSLQDVVKGKYLGKGNFGTVFEVLALDGRALSLHQLDRSRRKKWYMGRALSSPVLPMDPEIEEIDDENYDLNSECEENGNDEETISAQNVESRLKTKQEAAKAFMREHCLRETNKKPRYAIKILRPEVLDDPTTLYFQGIMDMATEARLLSSIQHPHVIKLRGVGHEPCTEKFFLILDRLYQTLDQRWKQWQKAHRRYSFLWGSLDCRGDKRAWMWQERIVCAHDLASGLAHLHSRNIIHRDIKSDNIGFDVRGDVKIFDFGLSRELPPSAKAEQDGTWKMTGSTGTPRYMSPEVALGRPYNESCDTYSFCILLWEMLALQTAFELYTSTSFQQRVWKAPHKRPFINPNVWPRPIQSMLQQGWDADLQRRQPMTDIVEALRQEAINRGGFDDKWGLEMERRSTHIFDEGDLQYLHSSHQSLLSMIAPPLRTVRLGLGSQVAASPRSPEKGTSKADITAVTAECDSIRDSVTSSPAKAVRSLPWEAPRSDFASDDDEEQANESSSFLNAERTKQQPATTSSALVMYQKVKDETVRRKRQRISGNIRMELDHPTISIRSMSDDDITTREAHGAISIYTTRSSEIYEEIKAETVRRERRRIGGVDEHEALEQATTTTTTGTSHSSVNAFDVNSASGIWARIREENERQTQLRSRLSMKREESLAA